MTDILMSWWFALPLMILVLGMLFLPLFLYYFERAKNRKELDALFNKLERLIREDERKWMVKPKDSG